MPRQRSKRKNSSPHVPTTPQDTEGAIEQAEEEIDETLEEASDVASRAGKVAAALIGVLIVIWFNCISQSEELRSQAKATFLKAKAEHLKAKSEIAHESTNHTVIGSGPSTLFGKQDTSDAEGEPDASQPKQFTVSTAITGSDNAKLSALEAEEVFRRVEKDNAFQQLKRPSTEIDFIGLKLRFRLEHVAPLWNGLVIFIISYLYFQRLAIWALCAEASKKINEFKHLSGARARRFHAHLPWWAAPLPFQRGKGTEAQKNETESGWDTLIELIGGSRSIRLLGIGVFILTTVVATLQLHVATESTPLADAKEFVRSGGIVRMPLGALSILIIALTVFSIWRWFRPIPFASDRYAWTDGIAFSRSEILALLLLAAATAAIGFAPEKYVGSAQKMITKQMPRLLTFGLGTIGAVALVEVALRSGKFLVLSKTSCGRRQFIRLGASAIGGVALLGIQHLISRRPRFVSRRDKERKQRFRDSPSPKVSLEPGFYTNQRLPAWYQKTLPRNQRSPRQIAAIRASSPSRLPEGGITYYVSNARELLFGRLVNPRQLTKIAPANLRTDDSAPPLQRPLMRGKRGALLNMSSAGKCPLPHVKLSRASTIFERAAIDRLRAGALDEACGLLITGIRHDLYYKQRTEQTRSTRLFDLLALIIYKYRQKDYETTFNNLIESAEKVFQPAVTSQARIHRHRHVRKRKDSSPPVKKTNVPKGIKLDDRRKRRAAEWEERKNKWKSKKWRDNMTEQTLVKWNGEYI